MFHPCFLWNQGESVVRTSGTTLFFLPLFVRSSPLEWLKMSQFRLGVVMV